MARIYEPTLRALLDSIRLELEGSGQTLSREWYARYPDLYRFFEGIKTLDFPCAAVTQDVINVIEGRKADLSIENYEACPGLREVLLAYNNEPQIPVYAPLASYYFVGGGSEDTWARSKAESNSLALAAMASAPPVRTSVPGAWQENVYDGYYWTSYAYCTIVEVSIPYKSTPYSKATFIFSHKATGVDSPTYICSASGLSVGKMGGTIAELPASGASYATSTLNFSALLSTINSNIGGHCFFGIRKAAGEWQEGSEEPGIQNTKRLSGLILELT